MKKFYSALMVAAISVLFGVQAFAATPEQVAAAQAEAILEGTIDNAANQTNAMKKVAADAIGTATKNAIDARYASNIQNGNAKVAEMNAAAQADAAVRAAKEAAERKAAADAAAIAGAQKLANIQKMNAIETEQAAKIAAAKEQLAKAQEAKVAIANDNCAKIQAEADAVKAEYEAKRAATDVVIQQAYDAKIASINGNLAIIQNQLQENAAAQIKATNATAAANIAAIEAKYQNEIAGYAVHNLNYQEGVTVQIAAVGINNPNVLKEANYKIACERQTKNMNDAIIDAATHIGRAEIYAARSAALTPAAAAAVAECKATLDKGAVVIKAAKDNTKKTKEMADSTVNAFKASAEAMVPAYISTTAAAAGAKEAVTTANVEAGIARFNAECAKYVLGRTVIRAAATELAQATTNQYLAGELGKIVDQAQKNAAAQAGVAAAAKDLAAAQKNLANVMSAQAKAAENARDATVAGTKAALIAQDAAATKLIVNVSDATSVAQFAAAMSIADPFCAQYIVASTPGHIQWMRDLSVAKYHVKTTPAKLF
ncbi:MAG: hypothetical protein K5985_00485 [Lachnospiraceae bacterium]|nr:hypothetical protein [Lachnospiraceae bacterium]